jgi:4-diphosphocytidyl-2-C-methyl-D-erythritol kinase
VIERIGPALVAHAPAKLNLGLEVLGLRADGYHDLATIFVAVEPTDRLSLTPAPAVDSPAGSRLAVDDPALADDDNLALRALTLLADESMHGSGGDATFRLHLKKRIPVAAGLGGASSDAAAALRLGREFWRLPLTEVDLAALALTLGSDVPFFLRGGCALATGRGERLDPLSPPVAAWFVIVAPDIAIPRKTATLYAALRADDFSDGSRVLAQAARLQRGEPLDIDLLANAFARPLCVLRPDLAELPVLMRRLGAPAAAVSGAGPSHYAVLQDPDEADRLASRLEEALGNRARVFTSPPLPPHPSRGGASGAGQ